VPLAVGQRLGVYEVEAPLGAGGMGEVYRARDAKLEREVALKLLPPAFAQDPDRRARFEREAKLLAALNHPAIGHLYGLEDADGQPFLVLELAHGEDLAARLARGRLPMEDALAIAKQVAEALEAAHERGIVHRDLKPGNVMVSPDGQVKVLDFGLAKAWDGDGAGTASGSGALSQSPTLAHGGSEAGLILGTAAYMSPEQARGKPVDKRADVWAFGVLLYELLSGRRLFAGETVTDVLAAVVRDTIDWSALPPDTPPRIRALLRRCLERDPKQRLRDIGEARIALAAVDEAPAAAPAPGPAVSRRSAAVLVAAASGAAFALGVGFGRRRVRGGERAQAEPLSITRITSSGNVTEAAISPDGRLMAYVESDQGEQSLWLRQLASGQTLRLAPSRRDAYWGHVFTRDGNSIVFGRKGREDPDGGLYSMSTLGGAPRRLVTGADSAPCFSPDGKRMAWLRARHPSPGESAVMIANADGSDARVLASVREPERFAPIFFAAPDWSPDAKRLATALARFQGSEYNGTARLVAIAVGDGRMETLADPGWGFVGQSAWLPDGSGVLAVASHDVTPQLWLVPLPSGEPRRVTSDLLDYRIVSLSADASALVTVGAERHSSLWLETLGASRSARRLTSANLDGFFGLDFAPDGRIAYTSVDGGENRVWVTSPSGSERSPLALGEGSPGHPRVTRTGQVFYTAQARSTSEVRRSSLDGATPRVIATSVLADDGLAVSPDESFVIYASLAHGESRLFRVGADGGTPQPFTEYRAHRPAFSPDGKRVAAYYAESDSSPYRIGIFPAEGGKPLQSLACAPPHFSSWLQLRDEGVYTNTVEGDRANVWLLPQGGGKPVRVTDFRDLLLNDFAFSRDGKALAYSRGPRLRDALLIRGVR